MVLRASRGESHVSLLPDEEGREGRRVIVPSIFSIHVLVPLPQGPQLGANPSTSSPGPPDAQPSLFLPGTVCILVVLCCALLCCVPESLFPTPSLSHRSSTPEKSPARQSYTPPDLESEFEFTLQKGQEEKLGINKMKARLRSSGITIVSVM